MLSVPWMSPLQSWTLAVPLSLASPVPRVPLLARRGMANDTELVEVALGDSEHKARCLQARPHAPPASSSLDRTPRDQAAALVPSTGLTSAGAPRAVGGGATRGRSCRIRTHTFSRPRTRPAGARSARGETALPAAHTPRHRPEAEELLKLHGLNQLPEKRKPRWLLYVEQACSRREALRGKRRRNGRVGMHRFCCRATLDAHAQGF